MPEEVIAYTTEASLRAGLAEIITAIEDALTTGEVEENVARVKKHIDRAMKNQTSGEYADILDDEEYTIIWSFYVDWKKIEKKPDRDVQEFIEKQRADLARQGLWIPLSRGVITERRDAEGSKTAEGNANTHGESESSREVRKGMVGKRGREEEAEDIGEVAQARKRGREDAEGENGRNADLKTKGTTRPNVLARNAGPAVPAPAPSVKAKRTRSPPPVAGSSRLSPARVSPVRRKFSELENDEEAGTVMVPRVVIQRKERRGQGKKKQGTEASKPAPRKPLVMSGHLFSTPCERCIEHAFSCHVNGTKERPSTNGACFSCSAAKVRCTRESNKTYLPVALATVDAVSPPRKKVKTQRRRVVSPATVPEDDEDGLEEGVEGVKPDSQVGSPTRSNLAQTVTESNLLDEGEGYDAADTPPPGPNVAEPNNSPKGENIADASTVGGNATNADQTAAIAEASPAASTISPNPCAEDGHPDLSGPGDKVCPNIVGCVEVSRDALYEIGDIVEERCKSMLKGFLDDHTQTANDVEKGFNEHLEKLEERFLTYHAKVMSDIELRFNKEIQNLEHRLTMELEKVQCKSGRDIPVEEVSVAVQTDALVAEKQPIERKNAEIEMTDIAIQAEARSANIPTAELAIQTDAISANIETAEIGIQANTNSAAKQHAAANQMDNNACSSPLQPRPPTSTTGAETPHIVSSATTAHAPHIEITPPTHRSCHAGSDLTHTGSQAPAVETTADGDSIKAPATNADISSGADRTLAEPPCAVTLDIGKSSTTLLPPRRSPRMQSRSPSPSPA